MPRDPPTDLTSFTSLYLSLMLPLNPPNVNLVAQLQRIVDCLSETEALTTIYNILPSSQSTFKPLKCTLLQKIIAASKHTKTQSLAVQHFLQSDLLSPESAQSITNTLLQDDSELALDFVSKLPAHAANERLHRCAFRLQLAKPAAFRFSSAAASLPESSLLAALFEHKPLDDKLLQVDGLPALNKDSLLVKQRSLALAEALAKGGDKVPYSEVRKILGENVDEEALEGAVIDGRSLYTPAQVILLTHSIHSSHQSKAPYSPSQQHKTRNQRDLYCPLHRHSISLPGFHFRWQG